MVAFLLCPVLVSRPVELVWVWCLSTVSGGSARPGQVVVGVGRFSTVNPGSVLALVVLRHPPYCEKAGRSGFHQQLLKFVDGLGIAMLTGSKDALLESVHVLLKCTPGQLVPTLTRRIRWWPFPGCLRV